MFRVIGSEHKRGFDVEIQSIHAVKPEGFTTHAWCKSLEEAKADEAACIKFYIQKEINRENSILGL